MDEHYLDHPYKGAPRMHTWLTQDKGYKVSYNRVSRLYYDVMGAQFTSEVFTNYILGQGIKLSMDGKGRATDNAFIERFWRSLKCEHIYLWPSSDAIELYKGIRKYMNWYNNERRHSSLDNQIPREVYEQCAQYVA